MGFPLGHQSGRCRVAVGDTDDLLDRFVTDPFSSGADGAVINALPDFNLQGDVTWAFEWAAAGSAIFGFVDAQGAFAERRAIEFFHGFLACFTSVKGHEGKSAWSASFPICWADDFKDRLVGCEHVA